MRRQMLEAHAMPSSVPRGRLPGQTTPERILRKGALEPLISLFPVRSSRDGNVEARAYWVTDGQVSAESVDGRDPFDVTEQITIEGATWAYGVTEVSVDGVLVAHPMAWAAYVTTDVARQWLMSQRLPQYRCMRM